jgi:PKD repeat protein
MSKTKMMKKKNYIQIILIFGLMMGIFLTGSIQLKTDPTESENLQFDPKIIPQSASEPFMWNKTYSYLNVYDSWMNESGIFIASNGDFVKFDLEGNMIWNLSRSYTTLWGDNTFLYTLSNGLTKLDGEGNVIWQQPWIGTVSGGKDAIWGDDDNIYGIGLYNGDNYLIKWDKITGNLIWNVTLPTCTYYGLTGNDEGVYCGSNIVSGPYAWNVIRIMAKNGTSKKNVTVTTYNTREYITGSSIWADYEQFYVGSRGDTYPSGDKVGFISAFSNDGTLAWRRDFCSGYQVYDYGFCSDKYSLYGYMRNETKCNVIKFNKKIGSDRWLGDVNMTYIDSVADKPIIAGIYNQSLFTFKSIPNVSLATWNISCMGQPEAPILNEIVPTLSTNGSVVLNWAAVPDATGYNVYRSASPLTMILNLTPISENGPVGFTDNGLTYGTYYYVIAALNLKGESQQSNCESVQVDVLPDVAINANSSSIIEGQMILFSITGIKGDPPATYQWNFGDGSLNSTLEAPIHCFSTHGAYITKLTVTDNNGNVSIASISISVGDNRPVASYTKSATSIIGNNSITFQFNGSLGNSPATLQWDFGDGSINSTVSNPTHLFTKAGIFPVVLTVNDSDGDISVYRSQVTIMADLKPTALFNASGTIVEPGSTVKFTWIGAKGNDPLTFQWDFGDKSVNSTQQNPSHLYSAAGVYVARLTVIDANGDSSIAEIKITVQFKKETDTGLFDTSGTAVIVGVAGAAALIGAAIGVAKKRR